MGDKKHALLIFAKLPVPGEVKTRLTKERGGFLTQEQAADFFQRCLYDVSELGMQALFDLMAQNEADIAANSAAPFVDYDFYISTTPEKNLERMKEVMDAIGPWPMEIHYLVDEGKTFDDHFDDAFSQLFELGYDNVVAIGADLPTMPKTHIIQAFEWLDYFLDLGTPGFVQAPCQECGTSLVGFNRNTPINNQGIYYNLEGRSALDGYVHKLTENDIPAAYLSPVADIDEAQDMAHAISCMRAIRQAADYQPDLFVPQRVLEWVDFYGLEVVTPPNDEHDPRQYIDK
ncbi:MAG: DUF2064 domain-containing protein [Eggerthellaceae bacterium]|nr:DUF2064 domain-containing protein [Eggerthellaceae bacterium]